jgi:hypothetical protein
MMTVTRNLVVRRYISFCFSKCLPVLYVKTVTYCSLMIDLVTVEHTVILDQAQESQAGY